MTGNYATVPAVAQRLADYVVLAHDPAVPGATAGYWELSCDTFVALDAEVRELVRPDPAGAQAHAGLLARPNCADHRVVLISRLTHLLAAAPVDRMRLAEELAKADERVWLDYHLGALYRPAVPAVTLDDMTALAARRLPVTARARSAEAAVHVVIPFRDRVGGMRVRNLLACLVALRDQDSPAGCHVTLVESDSHPRWRHVVEPLVDSYVFAFSDRLFNKSWTVNVGVVAADPAAAVTCVLDADILVDRGFLARNADRMRGGRQVAHVCCQQSLSLDEPSTAAATRMRCHDREDSVPLDVVRGVLLRDAPGGALWIRTDAFHRIGGFDERFEGWGGEDEDVIGRLRRAGDFRRFTDSLLHLSHPRPQMRTEDNCPFNGHLELLTWTGAGGYGDRDKYARSR